MAMNISRGRLLLAAAAASVLAFHSNAKEQEEDSPCRLWLARSTLSTESNPKLGLFAGVTFDENVTVGAPDIGIPLVDLNSEVYRQGIVEFLEGFLWAGDYAGAKWEANHSVILAVPGAGVLANYHSGTYNLDWNQGAVYMREKLAVPDAGVAHPSRGAVTTYYNLTLQTTQQIHAGMELFNNFGDVWDKNDEDDIYQDKLTRKDYNDADKVLDGIVAFMEKYDDSMTSDETEEVLDFLLTHVMGTAAGKRAKVLRSLLPAHPGKLQAVKNMGGTFAYRNQDMVMTQKWLRKHGKCMDNLKAGPSTISEAGRGAFATRSIKKNSMIAPAPMLHIPDMDILKIYNLEEVKDESGETTTVPNYQEPIGKQLIMNYCFGHPESSMLLFPVGSMVALINHKPAPQANAKIIWSDMMEDIDEWRKLDPMDMLDENKQRVGIIMEVVATKNINVGDEIFIDYGPHWTNAWDQYIQKWNADHQESNTWPIKAIDLNEIHKTEPYKTRAERIEDPYPEGVNTVCFLDIGEQDDGELKINEDGMRIDKWVGPGTPNKIVGSKIFSCEVLERTRDDGFMYNYTVIASEDDEEEIEVWHVPHFAVKFVDKPYHSDTFTEGAFRHWIGLPESVVPQAWRNRR